jgi:adenine-specific DNA-methyltransferase
MPHERIRPEFLFDDVKIKKLKEIAPECFEDGKINFETLRQNLGDWGSLNEIGEVEHFGLFWPGKKDARRLASVPPEGTLEAVFGEGLKVDGKSDKEGMNDSKNIFIEGENLEVLKILQKSYANEVKMIYIDPPYNTGNDFVYDDDFTEPLQEYLRRTSQIDEDGISLTTNKKSDGRFHSKWLSMMYPRLRVARNLLKEDGVIFVSIDDNEVNNLRSIMNEIFGEENFLAEVIVQSNKRGQTYKQLAKTHEYVIVYTKNADTEINELKKVVSDLNLEDNLGRFNIRELRNRNPKFGKFNRPNLFYPIYVSSIKMNNDGFHKVSVSRAKEYDIEVYPFNSTGGESCWRWGKELLVKNITEDIDSSNVVAKQRKDGGWNVYEKYRKSTYKAKTIWDEKSMITEQGTIETKKIGLEGYFDFPKPVELIKRCISIGTGKQDIILDFFAGSSTTAHAVIDINQIDKSSRNFICIQMPFEIPADHVAFKSGLRTISQISALRIKKAIEHIRTKVGFKYFKLVRSNYKKWNDIQDSDILQIEKSLELFSRAPLRDDWNKNKLLTELILLEGFPLDSSTTVVKIGVNNIIKVQHEWVPNVRQICLDSRIESQVIEELDLGKNTIFICFDSAINNDDKLRLSDKGLIKTI